MKLIDWKYKKLNLEDNPRQRRPRSVSIPEISKIWDIILEDPLLSELEFVAVWSSFWLHKTKCTKGVTTINTRTKIHWASCTQYLENVKKIKRDFVRQFTKSYETVNSTCWSITEYVWTFKPL